jgi:hypothetical protein
MNTYEYSVTVHGADDILALVKDSSAEEAPSMVYCSDEGQCFFDAAPNPYVVAIVEILNARGAEGWALVQVVPRQQDMICFWRRSQTGE